jgi:beta-phosphoglucomutase-like phosphatase (HAD superfamily)
MYDGNLLPVAVIHSTTVIRTLQTLWFSLPRVFPYEIYGIIERRAKKKKKKKKKKEEEKEEEEEEEEEEEKEKKKEKKKNKGGKTATLSALSI